MKKGNEKKKRWEGRREAKKGREREREREAEGKGEEREREQAPRRSGHT